MLLQKTGDMLKNYVLLRRKNGSEDGDSDVAAGGNNLDRRARSRSWMGQGKLQLEIPNLRRAASIARTQTRRTPSPTTPTAPITPIRASTTHSSTCPLCNCCHRSMSQLHSKHPLSKARAPSSVSVINIIYLESEDSPTGDGATWKTIFADAPSTSLYFDEDFAHSPILHAPSLALTDTDSTFDLFEALRLEPKDGGTTPKQLPRLMPDLPEADWTIDVEKLIRETDDAFKAVGFALADAKSVTHSEPEWSTGVDMVVLGGTVLAAQNVLPTQEETSSNQNFTIKRPHRSRPRKRRTDLAARTDTHAKVASQNLDLVSTTASRNTPAPRWTLTEMTGGVTDMFKFRSTQADEILTPDRLIQTKLMVDTKEATDTQQSKLKETILLTVNRNSFTTRRSGSTDEALTPIEPFHLQDLPSRLHASGISSKLPLVSFPMEKLALSAEFPGHSPQLLPQVTGRSQIIKEVDSHNSASKLPPTLNEASHEILRYQGHSFPIPPFPSPQPSLVSSHSPAAQRLRSVAIQRKTSDLATIDEVSPMTPPQLLPSDAPPTSRGPLRQSIISPLSPATTPDTARLPRKSSNLLASKQRSAGKLKIKVSSTSRNSMTSTAYTLTSPHFRHGNIRLLASPSPLSSTEITPKIRYAALGEPVSVSEGTFNSSIFQAAIAGGAGTYFQDGWATTLQQEEEVDISELVTWWQGHRLDMGRLIGKIEDESDVDQKRWNRRDVTGRHRRGTAAVAGSLSLGPGEVMVRDVSAVLVDGEAIIRRRDRQKRNQEEEKKRQDAKGKETAKEAWKRESGIPASLRIGYAATPVREAAYRRAHWGGIEKGSEIESLGVPSKDTGKDSNDKDDGEEHSLPPSPMLDYGGNGDIEGPPMGFNLTHDIKDFLAWENEHVDRRVEED